MNEQVGVNLAQAVLSPSLFTPDLHLFDLNRVETLRGPQGTLFGCGSVGGSAKAAVNLPLEDSATVCAVGYYTRYAGFIDALGYDAFTKAVLGAGTSAAVANGFPANSPFNSDLPFDIEQFAVLGEESNDITGKLRFKASGRYYDFKETRTITTGRLFANGHVGVVDRTASDGFTPRFLLSYEISPDITVNAQAAQGFRLGGVNDPLNTPLCNARDLAMFGGFQG